MSLLTGKTGLIIGVANKHMTEGVLGTDGAAAAKFSAEDLQGLLAPLV